MALRLPKNSLFAILLRSPWWVSFGVAGLLSLLAMMLLPQAYRAVGALSSLPFVVIGVIALSRQWDRPSESETAEIIERLASINWQEFAPLMREALSGDGLVVREASHRQADFEVYAATGCTLVSARRWKSARLGVEVLKELDAVRRETGAEAAVIVCLGEISEPAIKFSATNGISLWGASELALRLRGRLPASRPGNPPTRV